jgi:hypothetical protein
MYSNESWQATFLDAQNNKTRVIESFLLPPKWMFAIPSLGVVSPVQEKEIVMQQVLDNMDDFSQFDHGCAQNPLTLIIQDCTILHVICSNLV